MTSLLSWIPLFGPASTGSQSPKESVNMVLTVCGSTTWTSLSGSIIQPGLPLTFLSRIRLNLTSSAVNGLPLANLTSSRRTKVYSLPSGEIVHDLASTGTKVFRSSALFCVTRVSYVLSTTKAAANSNSRAGSSVFTSA